MNMIKDIITEIQESNPDLKELEPENEKAKYFKLKPGEKKVKAKIAKKKAKKNCPNGTTPSVDASSKTIKVKCTKLDKQKSRDRKKLAKTSAGKKASKTAQKQKKFRK